MSNKKFTTVFKRIAWTLLIAGLAGSHASTRAQLASTADTRDLWQRCLSTQTFRLGVADQERGEQQTGSTSKLDGAIQDVVARPALDPAHAGNSFSSAGSMWCNVTRSRPADKWALFDLTTLNRGFDKYSQSKSQSQVSAVTPTTSPEPLPTEQTFWTRETMTGDWGGARSRWKEEG